MLLVGGLLIRRSELTLPWPTNRLILSGGA
jgi:hypothetical protein